MSYKPGVTTITTAELRLSVMINTYSWVKAKCDKSITTDKLRLNVMSNNYS